MTLALHHHGPDDALPLVLLHGFPLDASMWDAVVALLPDVPVVTVDAPGFGGSAAAAGTEPSLEAYADGVADALAHAGVTRAVVAGLSMGGYAVLALAERHRGLLAGIGLLDTKASADDDAAREHRLAAADEAEGAAGSDAVAGMLTTTLGATTLREQPGVVADLRARLAAAPPDGIAWAQRAMAARRDRLHVLADLTVPALVLRGAEDAGAPQEAAEAMAGALPDVELVVVPRVGHMTALEAPAAVADALRALHARAR